jgi:mono/diheme cytochrome c family protein
MRRTCKYILPLAMALLFLQCASHKIAYNIPPDLPEPQRQLLMTMLERGRVLYKANCSDCHGIFTKGKDKVPNFSNLQLDNYSSRTMRRDPVNHAVMTQMSPEQLKDVLTFLRYKRQDSAAAVKKRI